MRIAIFSTCPGGGYAAGSYHGLMAGYCLARRGHEVWFVTDHPPVFDTDLRPISPENPVTIILTKDFEVFSDLRFDHVIVAAQKVQDRRVCMNAIRLAEHNQAALSVFCFDATQQPDDFASDPQPTVDWSAWQLPVSRGALILCATEESQRDAQEHFTLAHPETSFGVWQPAINQPAREAARSFGPEGDILIFARPVGGLTGADVIEELLVPELKDYRFVVVINDPRGTEAYCTRLQDHAARSGIQILFRFGLSDVERFEALDRASALVVPWCIEGPGYPLIEALATNTHCIAYDLPCLRESYGEQVRYVAAGNVAALRAELILALQDPPPHSAEHEHVLLRSDMDLRAKALEDVLENHRQQRSIRRTPSAKALSKLRADVTTPEHIRLGDRLVSHFMVATAHRISAAVFSGDRPATCRVVPTIAVNGAILHHILIDTALTDEDVPVWAGGKLYLTFQGQAGAVMDVPAKVKDLGDARAFSSSAVGVAQLCQGADGMSLLAWALPAQEYDSALWLTCGDGAMQCLPGDVGLAVSGHAKAGINPAVRCGIGFYLPERRTLAKTNYLLLLRNGAIVFSSEIPEAEIAAAELGSAVDISLPAAALNASEPLFRARSYQSPDRVQIMGWTNAPDRVVEVEVREGGADADQMRVVTRLSLNADRPDVAEQYGISRNDVGFSCVLPPLLEQGEYAIAFRTRGREIHQIAQMKVDADTTALPVMNTGKLLVSLSEELHEGSVPVVRRPPRQEIESFTYAPLSRTLTLKGWLLAKGRVKLTLVEAETLKQVASISKLVERADVATNFGAAFIESGLEIAFQIERLSRAGYLLQVTVGKVTFQPERLPVPQIAAVTEFGISHCQYDPQWRSLWVRGSFVCPGIRLSGIEIWQGGQILCTGAANIEQPLHGDPLAGWRVETVLDRPIDPTEHLEVRGTTAEGAIAITCLAPEKIAAAQPVSDLDEDVERLGLARTFRKRVVPPALEPARTVLVVVHETGASEQRDRVNALVALRAALAERGLQLVLFHHGQGGLPGDLPEVNFFDPFFDLLRQIEGADLAHAVRKVLPQERLSTLVGSLHGLLSSQNASPPDWASCSATIEDKAQRLYYVLRALNPRHVLLWGQTNALTQIGRGLCQGMGLSNTFLREGMLPNTVLYDQGKGTAQAEYVGATITLDQNGPTDEQASWLARAEAVITALREGAPDHRPSSDLRITAAARHVADSMGAKLVFYTGTNDWQSGTLPEPDGAGLAPCFRDSGDGLDALLEIAESRNWLILFKPHPDIYPRPVAPHPRLFAVRESGTVDCIDLCDVVVTLRSAVSYISLARRKATVLLGHMSLSGTGSAYEITARSDLAEMVSRAIGRADLPHRLEAFRNHVAALLRDHLYCLDPADKRAVRSQADLAERLCAELCPVAPGPGADGAQAR